MKTHRHNEPPLWADKLFRALCPPELFEELQGDLQEQFEMDADRFGLAAARQMYLSEVLKFAKPYFLKKRILSLYAFKRSKSNAYHIKPTSPLAMLQNYFTVARRNLTRHPSYSVINILGLVLGMTCAILIFSLVHYHLSFEKFHSKADRIYRVTTDLHNETVSKYGTVPQPTGAAMRDDYSFVEKSSMLISFGGTISIPSSSSHAKFKEPGGVAYVEPAFFEIMDFPMVGGEVRAMLSGPNAAVITEKLAEKFFPGQNAVGKRFRLDNKTDFTVTGIMQNLPENTDFRHEIFLSYSTISQTQPWLNTWGGIYSGTQAFVLLKQGTDVAKARQAMAGVSTKYYNAKDAKVFRFGLQPLLQMHMDQEYGGSVAKSQLLALSFIAAFIIITACVNFINLATAQALGRSKEIGVRKVMGSMRGQLFWQFITETALITVVAFVLVIGLAYVALPFMNQMLSTRVTFDLKDASQPLFIVGLLLVVIFVSGSYPGLILAGFQPIRALKGKLSQRDVGGFSVRKGLVVTQFAISQTLLIGTIVVTSQMRFNSEADMGFKRDAIVMLPVPETSATKISALRARITGLPGVEQVAFCQAPPASTNGNFDTGIRYAARAEGEKWPIFVKHGDPGYLPMFGLQLVAGRNLAESDTVREYLLNEMAVKKLGVRHVEEVLGKNANINGKEGIIVGVIKDFHSASFRQKIEPLCITTRVDQYETCAIKISARNVPATLAAFEKNWNEVNPEYIYSYQFLDEHLKAFYENDRLILQLMWLFAAIAIFIGCLGLYGLISFMAAQKTKEIGVRKTLGAGVGSIIWLFGRQFAQLLVVAFLIAAPVGWWLMDKYLADFKYHIDLNAAVFVAAAGISFMIAILTVGYRSIRAALMNPVKALRSE
ncbi:MAG: ABC transporter permease [Dyadobacter sp.]|uniref:ABC transporter permease n=1 Tax=Dyadobacter sp. TaxID=1914288 RepID=UPI001B123066|nr:ABC transporter permease [Dyadobacter sp.]MBO9611391.1 ABC transporter permease [Dyadobacter sp.]